MIRDALMEIGGVGLYGVVSVLLFFTVFGVAMVSAFRLRRPFLDTMGGLPLADDHGVKVKSEEVPHE